MKCSVVITNYNYACFLPETLNSVLSQTMSDFEVIVVDDGSTDRSKDIIEEFQRKDPRVKSIFLPTSQNGQNYAFQTGVAEAKGEIICCLDADDSYYPDMLERKWKLHSEHPECALVDSCLTDDGINYKMDSTLDFDYQEAYRKYGYLYGHNATSGLSVRKDFIMQFLPFIDTDEMWGGLDFVLAALSVAASSVCVDKKICGKYREHFIDEYKGRSENRDGGATLFFKKLKAWTAKQLLRNDIVIPVDDSPYFTKIVKEKREAFINKRIVVYGISRTSEQVIDALEQLGENIVYITDKAGRRSHDYLNGIMQQKYEYLPIESLKEREWDVIILAARQRNAIHKELENCSINMDQVIDLSL